ncbi:hypothetical protein NKR23_g8975 [Pleurostoma richardsiae]|uniref:Uncharacterized protein n=1 Tax=Pleurostoma richardsiae TaxID=41990 RepID=A0AA38RP78_9PEZI|nr:hypothetical protein NKR23_g8975 [Pleurostoma richardsiae]
MEGVLSFAPDVGNEAAEPYRAVLKHGEDRNTRRSPANLNEAIPGHGLYQLEAQRRVYGSLVRCAEELPDPSGPAAATEKSPRRKDGDESLPLLTRSSRLDYYGHPEMIDLKYLDSLVKTSLAEAQDDLWQLRRDAGLWANRLGVTPATPPGRVSNLLRTVFGRIDIFHTLSRHLDTVQQHDLFRSQYYARLDSKLPEGGDALRLLTSLHGVFSSVLEEEFDLLHSFAWSPQECASDTLSRLFRMVKTNDPSIRVMGLPAVMRVIDRELQESGMQEQVPFVVMQALNDMSVVAVCLRETAKHYNLVSSFNDHAILANELEEEWEKQERPWSSVVEDTLGALGGDERHKLNVHIHDKKVDVQSRHRAFWNDVDTHMETSSPGKESSKAIVNLIRQTAPIDAVPSRLAAATSHNDWFTGNDHSPQLTLTQINRSRRRNPCLSYQSPAPGPAQIPLGKPLPVIRPVQDRDFWKALLAPENRSELRWSGFQRALKGIGYHIVRQGGSARRFEFEDGAGGENPGTIVFHEPHGGKVSHREAQDWWLKRLKTRMTLNIEDQDEV